ncbi:hypothetical protein CXF59_01570 [Flavobacterium sp. ALD4]|nr:hypothetical protein CXF59_01570 [Flavobacterium sp. ALD4]
MTPMNTYYLHDGTILNGPFTLDELKAKKITKITSVWCEGMEDWKHAGKVEELKKTLFSTPPPIRSFVAPPTGSENDYITEIKKFARLNKKTLFLVGGMVVLIIGTLIFNSILESRSLKLKERNNRTEYNNNQYKIQQKEIEDQKSFIAEQQRIELERIEKERKLTINDRLSEIKNLLAATRSNLNNSKYELNDAQEFQFLRSNEEREDDISAVENNIIRWRNEIAQLEKEMSLLYLELEKIH